MCSQPERHAHKRAVRAAFDRAASHYDTAAGVQREICDALAAAMPNLPDARCVLDAGCGTGYALEHLQRRCPQAGIIALDFAPAMLERIAGRGAQRVCGDIERMPFADASFDLVWSSLALQWCDPQATLGEFARSLRPGGTLWLATLGPRTLSELRTAFRAVDEATHVLDFNAAGTWLAAAQGHGLQSIYRHDFETAVLAPNLRGILRHLKGIGAHRVSAGPRRPLTRAQWRRLEEAYETHRRSDGMLPARYDVMLFGFARNTR